MILISIKKVNKRINDESISIKHLLIYSFFIMGSLGSLIRTTKYPIDRTGNDIISYLTIIPVVIYGIMFYKLYSVVKEESPKNIAFKIIPIYAVLAIRYWLCIILPLIIVEVSIIKILQLDFAYWNAINSSIISIIYAIAFAFSLINQFKHK